MKDKNGRVLLNDDVVLCVVDGIQKLVHVKDTSNVPEDVKNSTAFKIIANAKDMPNLIK